jgi:hypothetical protein
MGVKSAIIVTYAIGNLQPGHTRPVAHLRIKSMPRRIDELQNRVLIDICTLEGELLNVEMDRGGFTVC